MVRERSSADALNSDSTVLEVQPRGMGWAVENKSSLFGDTSTGYDTKSKAVKAAKRKAKRKSGTVKVRILKESGGLQDTRKYK